MLPDRLSVQVELAPIQTKEANYFNEFLALEELHEFDLECRSHVAFV